MIPQSLKKSLTYLLLVLPMFILVLPTYGQGLKDYGNREEGVFTLPISTPPLQLISFTGFFEDYQPNARQKLKIQFFLDQADHLNIKAQQTRGEILYRMQPKPFPVINGWNQFAPWPVDDVLSKLNMPAQNIGVIVNYQDRQNVLAPAIVFHSNQPEKIASYNFTFLPGKNLTKIRYRIYQGDFFQKEPQAEALVYEKYLGRKSKYGGIALPLIVPVSELDVPDNWAGWLTLVFEAREISTNELVLYTYYFFHQPILPKYETELFEHSRSGG